MWERKPRDPKSSKPTHTASGFSLVELLMSLVLSLFILGVAVATFSGALGSRDRESSRTDAITSAQAALNIMSREIGNAGYGIVIDPVSQIPSNGIVFADSNANQLHFRTNIENVGTYGNNTDQEGEDITYYCESCNGSSTGSVVRSDKNVNGGVPSGIINRVSDVDFAYSDVNPTTGIITNGLSVPSLNTVKVSITLKVILAEARGQPANRQEKLKSEVTLRNSTYMLQQY
jgi:Tfp pilus assembly protein PilW